MHRAWCCRYRRPARDNHEYARGKVNNRFWSVPLRDRLHLRVTEGRTRITWDGRRDETRPAKPADLKKLALAQQHDDDGQKDVATIC